MIRQLSSRRHQAGTAAVEAVVVLPFLLFMMLAIAELGQAVLFYNELTKSTRDAARHLAEYAIVGSTDVIVIDPTLEKETVNIAVYGNTAGTGYPIVKGLDITDVNVNAIDDVHVQVDVEFQYIPLLGLDNLPTFGLRAEPITVAVPLRASAVMRAL